MADWQSHDGKSYIYVDGLRADLRLRNGEILTEENVNDWMYDALWFNREKRPDDIVAFRRVDDD